MHVQTPISSSEGTENSIATFTALLGSGLISNMDKQDCSTASFIPITLLDVTKFALLRVMKANIPVN